jgi:HemY protein
MKTLILIAIALLFGAAFIWFADFEPGFVLLQYGAWTLETSLIVLFVGMFLLFFTLYYFFRSLVLLRQSPSRLKRWSRSQRQKRANHALTRGLITLEEGRWAEAERILLRFARDSETPLLHYLAAARAAQKQDASSRRDNYLKLAHETTTGADIAVGVVQAELQLAAGQKEQAIATLQHLREMAPKHPYVLQLLNQLYQDMQEWQSVQAVLPDLRKRHVLENAEVKSLSQEVMIGQLHAAMEKQDWRQFDLLWSQSPSSFKHNEATLIPYVKGLMMQGEMERAKQLIEQFMRKAWSETLASFYGQLQGVDVLKALATAEHWLSAHKDNAVLLLTLGRLAQANKLWMKAEDYLKQSNQIAPKGETFAVLAEVKSAQGKQEEAAEAYQSGLRLMLTASSYQQA